MKVTWKNQVDRKIDDLRARVAALESYYGSVPLQVPRHEGDEYPMIVPLTALIRALLDHLDLVLEHIPEQRQYFAVKKATEGDKNA
jgi:hypothetical protein